MTPEATFVTSDVMSIIFKVIGRGYENALHNIFYEQTFNDLVLIFICIICIDKLMYV